MVGKGRSRVVPCCRKVIQETACHKLKLNERRRLDSMQKKMKSLKRPTGIGIGNKKLLLAYERVKADATDDLLPDLIGYKDYDVYLQDNFTRLLKDIANYRPSDCVEIDVPKSPYFSRPASALSPDDRIIYQAVINSIAQKLDQRLESRTVVFGYRVTSPTDARMFGNPIGQWLQFRKALRSIHTSGYNFLVRTDLVGYFEHISHDLLREKLEIADVKPKTIELLFHLLERWRTSTKHGLPQGADPSSLLANYYLDSIDKQMLRPGFKYVRYMDDICIFGKNPLEIKKAAACLTAACRTHRLFLNAKKTEVLEGAKIREFLDKDQDVFGGINYLLDIGAIPLARKELNALVRKAFGGGKIDDRRYKYALNRLRSLRDPVAVKRVLDALEVVPHLADVSSRYLREFCFKRAVRKRILTFLESEANIYPWQEMWMLRALFGAKKLTRSELDQLRARTLTASHWINKSLYILLLGKYGDTSDLDFCWAQFRKVNMVDRAVVLSCQRLRKNIKLQRCNEAVQRAPELTQTAGFVKGSSKPVWPD